jgi:hypothetical protein
VLEDQTLAPDLADEITRKVYRQHFGTSFSAAVPPANGEPGISLKTSGVSLLVAALLDGLVGYFLAWPRSQSALAQQLAYAQMLGARSPRGGVSELMLYELMGGSPVGGEGTLGRGLPQITNAVRIVFFVFFLLWITRTKVWNVALPTGVPNGIYVARWVALLAAILGLGRCVSGIYITLRLFAGMGGGGRQTSMSIAQWLPLLGVLDQLWAIAFWLTLMVVLFTLANQLTLRFVRQSQRSAG